MKLTPKQQAFCDYYLQSLNATEAAVKAGYSKKTATAIGQENLTKPYLRAYLDERMKQIESKRIAKTEEILQFLTSVVRGEVSGATLRGVGMGEQTVDAIPPTINERVKAAELLGKRYAMWTDKQQMDVNAAVVIVDDIED